MHRHAWPVLLAVTLLATPAYGASRDSELRSVFDRFIAAQNAHDLAALSELLTDSPDLLWITRGTPVWGRADALARFGSLYAGTWRLEPDTSAFRVVFAQQDVAQIYVPVTFTIGATGQEPQRTAYLMNQLWRRERGGWRIVSLLPIPAAAAR